MISILSKRNQISLATFFLSSANAFQLDKFETELLCFVPLTAQGRPLTPLKKRPFENIVRKGEIAHSPTFSILS